MNNPDESTIQRWLKGELEGNELKQMESWAEENAEELEAKMGWESLSDEISQTLPSEQEPPYADFFNERVKHHAVELPEEVTVERGAVSLWKRVNWLFAPMAVAGMALCFYLGTRLESGESGNSPVAVAALEEVYTPASGVSSEVTVSGESTVIVLEGLESIPESLDIAAGETSQGESPRMMVKAERNLFYY